jgi:catechol 2,3-dioxygenase-like lactoylglutathione lyase family enzyme
MNTTSIAVVKFSVEVITLPMSDVARALRFYVDQVGFTLDVDYYRIKIVMRGADSDDTIAA